MFCAILKTAQFSVNSSNKPFNKDSHLEVEDDCPDEAEHHSRLSIHHVAGVDVDKLDLKHNGA